MKRRIYPQIACFGDSVPFFGLMLGLV